MRAIYFTTFFSLSFLAVSFAQPAYTDAARRADEQLHINLKAKLGSKYNHFAPTRDSLTAVFRDTSCLWALLDAEGGEILMPRYSEISLLGGGLLRAQRGGKISYYLRAGSKLQPLQYNKVEWLGADMLLVELANQQGLISPSGTGILPAQYDEILRLPALLLARRGTQWAAFTLDGSPAKGLSFSPKQQLQTLHLHTHSAALAAASLSAIAVQEGDSYQLIDLANGKPLLTTAQKYLLHYTRGNILFIENEAAFFGFDIDKQQQRNTRYDALRSLNLNLWAVKQNGKWGIIATDGKEVFPCQYDTIYADAMQPKFLQLQQGTKYSLYDTEKRSLLFAERELPIIALAEGLFALSEKAGSSSSPTAPRYHLQSTGSSSTKLLNNKWEAVLPLSSTHFAAQEKGLWGIYTAQETLIKPQYKAVRKQVGGAFQVSEDGKTFYFVNAKNAKLLCLKE